RYQTEKYWELVEVEKAVASVNRTFEVDIQGRIDVAPRRFLVKENIAVLQGRLRQRERDRLAARFRRVAVCHVGVCRQARWNSTGAHHEQPVVVSAGRSDCTCNA